MREERVLSRLLHFVVSGFCLALNLWYRGGIVLWNMHLMVAFRTVWFLGIWASHASFCHMLITSVVLVGYVISISWKQFFMRLKKVLSHQFVEEKYYET